MPIRQQEIERLRSDEVQEILGTPPKWMVRWGTTLAFLFLGFAVALSLYLKFPEKIQGEIVLTSTIPPTEIVALQDGYIEEVLVKDSASVSKGDLLAIISSTTKFKDLTEIETKLDQIKSGSTLSLVDLPEFDSTQLTLSEEIQEGYSRFRQALESFHRKVKGSSEEQAELRYKREIATIRRNIRIDRSSIQDIENRIQMLGDYLKSKQDDYNNEKIDFNELEQTSNQIAQNRRAIRNYEKRINEQKAKIKEIESRMRASAQSLEDAHSSSLTILNESIDQLRSRIESWKQNYLMTAQINGVVILDRITADQQFVKAGDVLMTILPSDSTLQDGQNQIVGTLEFPTAGAGKVAYGQEVKVKLSNYPAHEFGLVVGFVAEEPRLPKNDTYTIQVLFPSGLTTTFGKQLRFDQRMSGSAFIITEDKSFAHRIFEKVIEVFI